MNSHEIEDPPAAPFQDTTRREPLSSTPLNNTTTLDSQDPIYSVEAIENRVEQLRTYQDEQVEVRSRSPSIPSTPLNPSCLPLSNNISFNSSFEKDPRITHQFPSRVPDSAEEEDTEQARIRSARPLERNEQCPLPFSNSNSNFSRGMVRPQAPEVEPSRQQQDKEVVGKERQGERGKRGRRKASPVEPWELVGLLERQGKDKVLVIDTRCLNAFLGEEGRIKGSINVAFPSLLCKRLSKLGSSGGGACSKDNKEGLEKFSLEPFITTSLGKSLYSNSTRHNSTLLSGSGGKELVIVDDKMHERSQGGLNPGLVLLGVLEKKRELEHEEGQGEEKGKEGGGLWYLDRALGEAAKGEERLRKWVVWGENQDETNQDEDEERETRVHLHPQTRTKPTLDPIIASPSPPFASSSSQCASPTIYSPHQRSLASDFPPAAPSSSISNSSNVARQLPKLKRIDTSENLLGAHSRPGVSSATITNSHHNILVSSIPPVLPTVVAQGNRKSPPPRLNLNLLNITDSPSDSSSSNGMSLQEMCHSQSKSPPAQATRFGEAELVLPSSPSSLPTSHPLSPLEDPDSPPPFEPSTILPSFLYLGQEPLRPSDLAQLRELGINEILNLAVECPDKDGRLEKEFEKYWWEPMRDSVEELGVQNVLIRCCRILNEARLRDKKVYVHCRAGKSRSVTIVLGYLLYQMGWSLKRAYQYVQERREGISPNLGFMAELMTFEELLRNPSHASNLAHSSSSSFSPSLNSLQRSHSATTSVTISSLLPTPTSELPKPILPLPGFMRFNSDLGPRVIPNESEEVVGGAKVWMGTSRAVRAIIGGEGAGGEWRESGGKNTGELEARTSLENSPIASCG